MSSEQGFNHVDWSYSTARLYQSCPRRFYYRYKPSSSDASGEKERSISPPGAAVGSAVHDCIEAQIDRWHRGKRLSLQAAQNQATEQLQDYVNSNEDYLRREYTIEDEEFNLTDRKRSLIRTAHTHIERFFQVIWPQFSGHEYILHEVTKSITIEANTVWVRPDLCTRDGNGDFVVTDWKTTSPDPFGEPSLQLLTYALWAHQEYEPSIDRILVQLVHTSTGDFDQTRPDETALAQLKLRIRADRQDWSTRSQKSEFPPKPTNDKCRSCPELSHCAAGQTLLEEES